MAKDDEEVEDNKDKPISQRVNHEHPDQIWELIKNETDEIKKLELYDYYLSLKQLERI